MSRTDDAQAALVSVSETESRLAEHMEWPLWRHAIVGGIMGLLVFAQTLEGTLSLVGSFSAVLIAILVARADKRRDGISVQVFRKGRLVWIGIGLVTICGIAVVAVRLMEPPRIERPLFWLITIGIVVLGTALSYVWQKLYQAELRRGWR